MTDSEIVETFEYLKDQIRSLNVHLANANERINKLEDEVNGKPDITHVATGEYPNARRN